MRDLQRAFTRKSILASRPCARRRTRRQSGMGPPSLAGEQLLGNYDAALVIGNGAFSGVQSRNQALHGQRPATY